MAVLLEGEIMASPTTVVAPSYQDRRGWLIVLGVVEFLIAGWLLLNAANMALIMPKIPTPGGQPAARPGAFLVFAGFYVLLAALFIAIGIGSILARNWARIAIIAVSSIWLVYGILNTIISVVLMPVIQRQQEAVLQQMHPGSAPPNLGGGTMFFIIVYQAALMIALPLILLLFYVNSNVKATCLRLSQAPAGSLSAASINTSATGNTMEAE
jgi:hypothetical protein